eukprot:CCRYP_004318-RC/>CCRYP_004318-RC protein AED:0.05 eAED:0.05 QI:175/1/1/1/0.85/0.75/8/326/1952
MNLQRTAAAFLICAASTAAVSWVNNPLIQTRTGEMMDDDVSSIVVTVPTTGSSEDSESSSADSLVDYYGNKAVDYYGSGVAVTVNTIQENSSTSVSGSSISEASSSSTSSFSGPTKGGASKKSEAFWSATASKGTTTGLCLHNSGSQSYASSYSKDSSVEYAYKGYSKKSRSSPHEMCTCAMENDRRNLQWGNDGHSSNVSANKVSSGTSTKVSGDDTNKSSGESSSKITSGSSKVTTVKVSGNTSKMTSGGGMWAGDAHGASKMTGSSSKMTSSEKTSSEKTSSEKTSESKVSGTSSKMSAGGGMWAGDAYGMKSTEKVSGSSKMTSIDKKTESKVSGTSSKMTSGGGMWAGDAYGMNKMTSEKTSKISSSKGGSVSFKVKTSYKEDDVKTTKTVVSAKWQGENWGPSKVTETKTSESSLKGTAKTSVEIATSSTKVSSKSDKNSLSLKESYAVDTSCSCKTNFQIAVCGATSSMPPPTPAPVLPMAPNPSTPVDTLPPTLAGSLEVNEVSCSDDFAMTNAGVAVEIPVLDNDLSVPVGSTGSITQPGHGLSIITDSSILYVPDTDSCGIDSFTYTLTDSSGQSSCTATVTVTVTCIGGASTPPPTATPTTEDEIIPHDTDLNPRQPTNMPVDFGGSLNIPTMMPLDAPVLPDGGDLEVEKPVANDDFFTTNQDESIAIFPLLNDTLFEGTTGSYTTPSNGAISMTDDDLVYTPNSGYCGIDMFSYTLTDITGEHSDSAIVTIFVICQPTTMPTYFSGDDLLGVPPDFGAENPSIDRFEPTAAPSGFSGDDSLGVPPNFNQGTGDRPTPEPTLFSGDDALGVPPNFNQGTGDRPTPEPTLFSGDDALGVPPNINQGTGDRPTPEPTLFSGDDALGVPQNFNQGVSTPDRPVLKDDFATTNQSVPVFIPILDNDYIPTDSTGTMGNSLHGEIDATDSGIIFTPLAQFCGYDKFEYTVTDATGKFSDTATVTVEVICAREKENSTPSPTPSSGDDLVGVPPEFSGGTPIIDRPKLNDDFATTNENIPVIIPILANDTIPNDSTGSFSRPENGVVTILDGDDILYSPNKGFCGTDSFTYTIVDSSNISDTATVMVGVACEPDSLTTPSTSTAEKPMPPTTSPSNMVNDKPETNDDFVTTPQGVPVIVPVMENDVVPVNSTGEFDEPSHGGVSIGTDGIVYTPSDDFCGVDSFNYTITDASGMYSDSAVATVEVICKNVNQTILKPDAINDYLTIPQDSEPVVIPVLDNDIAPEGYDLYVDSIVYNANNGVCSMSDDGMKIIYSPNIGYSGQDSCVYSACAEVGSCDDAVVLITIEPIGGSTTKPTEMSATAPSSSNQPPVASDDDITTLQDQPVFINVAANDEDAGEGALTVTTVSQCKEGGTLVIIGDGTGGVVQYTPAPGFSGNDHCDYTICNEIGGCSSACVIVTVEKAKVPPLAVNDAAITKVDAAIEIEVTDNDISPNGSPLTIVDVGNSSKGAIIAIVSDGSSGFVFYEPPVGFVGKDKFTYTIMDGEGSVSTANVFVTVESMTTATSPASSGTDIPLPSCVHTCTTTKNAAVIYVVASDATSFITDVMNGTNGMCTATANSTIMYTPEEGFSGNDECEFQLCSRDLICEVGLLTITVLPDGSSATETTTTVAAQTTSSVAAETTSTVAVDTSSTQSPGEVIPHGSDNSTEVNADMIPPLASYMCPDEDPSTVTENRLLYKYPIILNNDTDVDAAIQSIEVEINDSLVTQMRCSISGTRRKLLIAKLVGADSNPPDYATDEECEAEDGPCIVINGGLTVYGDVDVQDVQHYISSVLPDIVSSAGASVINSLLTSNATLDSRNASTTGGPSTLTTVAIAGAAVVALLGAALIVRKKKSTHENINEESEAGLMTDFSRKTPSPREIPHASSNDSDTLLTTSVSIDSKSRRSPNSVFRNNRPTAESRPSSPAFSVSSLKSKSYDVEDTVDL